jgi:cytoskeletal protein CcmA (bactofilin family)
MKFGSSKPSYGSSGGSGGGGEVATDLRSFLGEGTDINGEVKFSEIMRVDATISGTITSESGSLLVMEKGRVKATVQASIVEVSGIVEGTITAKTSVKIHPTGRVYGDIYTPALIIEHGAVFDGKCHMLNGKDKGFGKGDTSKSFSAEAKGLNTATA